MRGNITIFALLLISLSPLFGAESAETRIGKASPNQSAPNNKYITVFDKFNFIAKGERDLVTTFTISAPGSYYLTESVGYAGRNAEDLSNADNSLKTTACAIYINSNDVVIDLGNYTLYHDVGTATATSDQKGIHIADGCYNVVVRNGNITGFQDTGILVRKNCDNIRMKDLTITQCGQNGIQLLGVQDTDATDKNMITNCIIENSMVGRTTGITGIDAVGLRMDYCFNILVNDSAFNRCDVGTLPTISAVGAFVSSCTNVTFTNCDASGNRGSASTGFHVGENSDACSFINCTANGNWATGISNDSIGIGFNAYIANGCLWENCTANGNEGTLSGYGFKYNNASYCKTTKCKSSYNNAGSRATIITTGGRSFFSRTGIGNIWDECEAVGSQVSLDIAGPACIGFDLLDETRSMIQNSISRNHNSNSSASWGIGINIQGTSSRCVIDNCSITHNRSATTQQGVGLRDTNGGASTTLVTRCFFFDNGDDTSDSTVNAQNFHLDYNPGEFNITNTVNQGSMGSLTGINPYQNVSLAAL
jgi:hypothetical protein